MNWRRKKVKEDRYYVVDLSVLHKPVLFRNDFKTKAKAEYAIEEYLGFDFKTYVIIIGKEAKKHNLKFKAINKGKMATIPVTKYKYPPHRITTQSKKNYRTILRRKLRKLKQS